MTLTPHYFQIDAQLPTPLYQQIQDNIVELIENNLLNSGDALPAERLLSDYYQVNRMTVRQAIEALVQKGLLYKKHGAGTFVSEKNALQTFTPSVMGFSQRMREAGLATTTHLLQRAVVVPSPIIAHRLRVTDGSKVLLIKRLRMANNEPLMIETSYLSYEQYPALAEEDLETQSLYHLLEALYNVRIVEAEHTLEPILTTPFETQHLGVEAQQPAMLVRVLAYTRDRTPVEFSKSIVRGDRCRYYFQVHTRTPIIN